MTWSWRDEPDPPQPQGVIGIGSVARHLLTIVERLAQGGDTGLMATANDDVLILTGPAQLLPWADGVQYIAPHDEATALWLPVAERPAIPIDLLEQAIRRKHPRMPMLLLREPGQLVPLTRLLPADAGLLRQIRSRWQGDQ
ncbi:MULTISPECIES: hypothetical protein [unclassified Lysobacter]|uniref:bpX5 domain-containing protein n=1 Tax=unclassified Lysobacter TaxID=2635362 RepID=UPI0006FD9FD0|nr:MULTISPECIES: hypothetical protein [unclassified Lysobacter]KRA21134.1 hypothetical protein ASD69_07600 [Lysobacter sp. Root604]KRD80166.1 hypothetical protein ASE43_04635 [Lysobacter sp. Root983]